MTIRLKLREGAIANMKKPLTPITDCIAVLAFASAHHESTKGGSKVKIIGMLRHNKVWAREYLKCTDNYLVATSQTLQSN